MAGRILDPRRCSFASFSDTKTSKAQGVPHVLRFGLLVGPNLGLVFAGNGWHSRVWSFTTRSQAATANAGYQACPNPVRDDAAQANEAPVTADAAAPSVDAEVIIPDAAFVEFDAASGVVEPEGDITTTEQIGGDGGDFDPVECPQGHFLVGFMGDVYDRGGFCNLRARCSRMQAGRTGLERVGKLTMVPDDPVADCEDEEALGFVECGPGQFVAGFSGYTSGRFDAVTEVQLRCATQGPAGAIVLENSTKPWGEVFDDDDDFTIDCPADMVATGFGGRSGAAVDALYFNCQRLRVF